MVVIKGPIPFLIRPQKESIVGLSVFHPALDRLGHIHAVGRHGWRKRIVGFGSSRAGQEVDRGSAGKKPAIGVAAYGGARLRMEPKLRLPHRAFHAAEVEFHLAPRPQPEVLPAIKREGSFVVIISKSHVNILQGSARTGTCSRAGSGEIGPAKNFCAYVTH